MTFARIGGQTGRIGLLVVAAAMGGCSYGSAPEAVNTAPGQKPTVYELEGERFTVQTALSRLEAPWALGWLPDGTMLVTERPGRLLLVDPSAETPRQVIRIAAVDAEGEHGLMGLAVSPDFAGDRFLFMSYTHRTPHGLVARISRFVLQSDRLFDEKVLIDDLPAGDYHDGLPLAFGPDGLLYASTGDAAKGGLSQDLRSLGGKFLRIDKNGKAPADNPYAFADGRRSPIWTVGNRNCQGFSWDPITGELYATEHGPTAPIDGILGGGDEINRIRKGCNYGWPVYHHDANGPVRGEQCIAPLKQWTPAIAPSGAAFYTAKKFPGWYGRFLFAGLRSQALWCATFADDNPDRVDDVTVVLERQFGRLRAVAVGPDGLVYLTTSNRDRRGSPVAQDDRVLRLVPAGPTEDGGKGERGKKSKPSRKPKPARHSA